MSVIIETTIGDITIDLFLKERPNTCLNFLKLCKIKYYNLCLFQKVERNFIAQTGDPTGTGRGGESVFSHLYGDQAKYFDSELKPRIKHEKIGTLSMVNNGNNMNGSQFFLTLGENLTYLDEVHTVFGEVVEGFNVLLKLNEAICDPNNRPYQDIRITHTVILHDPYDDPSGLEIPDASPEPTKEMLETDYIAPDEEIDDTKGKNMEEIEEKIKENEAKARATILEMVGDIPDADVKPPEDVLFVCKLNPVTESKDLELIFSRFGPIKSCEVIKDKKSGESLQYAFIEFEREEDCENAYFKMDNVLIDDRRIHVDFSQSVSKLTWDQKNLIKGNRGRIDNLKIKDNKMSDGYEMIFDMNSATDDVKHKKDIKSKKSSDKRSQDSSKYSDSSSKKRSYSSHVDEPLKHKESYYNTDNQSRRYKESYEKMPKQKYSRTPSPVKSFHKRSKNHRSRSPVQKEYRSISSNKRTTHHDSSECSSPDRKKSYNKKGSSSDYHRQSTSNSDHKSSYSNIFKNKDSKYNDNVTKEVSHKRKKEKSHRNSSSVSPDCYSSRKSIAHSGNSDYYAENKKSKYSSRNRSDSESPPRSTSKNKKSHSRGSHKKSKKHKKHQSSSSSDSSDSDSAVDNSKYKSKSKISDSSKSRTVHKKYSNSKSRHRRSSS